MHSGIVHTLGRPYAITDEATGVRYVVDYGWEYLDSGGEQYLGKVLGRDLDSFLGYRFTVNGPVIEGSGLLV